MSAQGKVRDVERVGQVLIVGFDGTGMTSRLRSLLSRLQPAGVILFARKLVLCSLFVEANQFEHLMSVIQNRSTPADVLHLS